METIELQEKENNVVKTDLYICLIDVTEFWNKSFRNKIKSGKIFDVCLFDKNRHVHCCELTPSYELNYITAITEKLLSDENFDIFLTENGKADNEEIQYYHVSDVDSFPVITNLNETWKSGVYKYDHDFTYNSETKEVIGDEYEDNYDKMIEHLIEYYNGNPVFC